MPKFYSQPLLPNVNYYLICLLGLQNGNVQWSFFSGWDDFTKKTRKQPRRDKRGVVVVDAEAVRAAMNMLEMPPAILNSAEDLVLYAFTGGNALITERLCEEGTPHLLESAGSSFSYTEPGFTAVASKPRDAVWHRKAQGTTRQIVLARDGNKCRKCGAKNEIEVHHINPWDYGGLTEPDNLITLCHACHPHSNFKVDLSLYELIGLQPYAIDSRLKTNYYEGMLRLKKIATKALQEEFPFLHLEGGK
jgi:hypothetical protein